MQTKKLHFLMDVEGVLLAVEHTRKFRARYFSQELVETKTKLKVSENWSSIYWVPIPADTG